MNEQYLATKFGPLNAKSAPIKLTITSNDLSVEVEMDSSGDVEDVVRQIVNVMREGEI